MSKYKDAGVDLRSAESIKDRIAEAIRSTFVENVLTAGGEFGGVYQIPDSDLALVASVDGVGTKLKVAVRANKHDTIGQDLVNHCVNDIAVMGATPALFLDYLSLGELDEEVTLQIISGLVQACREHSVALIAGETAQMPDIYSKGEYDLAGTVIGFLHPAQRLPMPGIQEGDILLGFASDGLHTNGYSLARRIVFEQNGWDVDTYDDQLGRTWGAELLRVHRSYLRTVRAFVDEKLAKGFAHITGGGIPGNLSRIVPNGLRAEIKKELIPTDPVFNVLQAAGQVSEQEMYDVFNMGIGLIAICEPSLLDQANVNLADHATQIGAMAASEGGPKVLIQ